MSSRMNEDKRTAYLGLGGNIGDVKITMADALQGLDAMDEIDVVAVSSLYKTPPWGMEDQPWFLNCCAEIETSLSPEELLDACQQMEREGRRMRTVRWGPRTIDVDIVAMQGIEQTEQRLTIPHPRATERDFVMVPLADIASDLVLGGKTVGQWVADMKADQLELESTSGNWWQDLPET